MAIKVRLGVGISLCVLLVGCTTPQAPHPSAARTLHVGPTHIQLAGPPEWSEFGTVRPIEGPLELRFSGRRNRGEQSLFIRQENVKLRWKVDLNGHPLGDLHSQEAGTVRALAVPPETLVDGENLLVITPPAMVDHVVISDVRLDPRPFAYAVGETQLTVTVHDGDAADPKDTIASRITIVDTRGHLPPLLAAPDQRLAVRPGVVYTGDGRARVWLPAGHYTVYASRGPEYGVDQRRIDLRPGDHHNLVMRVHREVPTPNLIAMDPHIHTLAFSGHGDASAEDRVLTLAGEGVELPIATEHNQHSDYASAARRMGVRKYFTPILGNEVTTGRGHFSTFPVMLRSAVPNPEETDWPTLIGSIRALTGAQVVILNHPLDVHAGFTPFAPENYDNTTGENLQGPPFTFDAIELVNSGTLRSDPMDIYRDWFALLNRGYRIYGVGSSDCHDVNRFIVGQGRTLVVVPDDAPDRIDVDQVIASVRAGRMLVSLGLITRMWIETDNQRFDVGDLASDLGSEYRVTVTVAGPSWTQVDRVMLYENGVKIHEIQVPAGQPAGEKIRHTWRMPRSRQDSHLVAIAIGPGVESPHWPIPRPYQPSTPVWSPYVIASTNPIWVDGDGNGRFQAPFEQAPAR